MRMKKIAQKGLAVVLSAAMVFGLMPGMGGRAVIVKAAENVEPSASQFATVDDLKKYSLEEGTQSIGKIRLGIIDHDDVHHDALWMIGGEDKNDTTPGGGLTLLGVESFAIICFNMSRSSQYANSDVQELLSVPKEHPFGISAAEMDKINTVEVEQEGYASATGKLYLPAAQTATDGEKIILLGCGQGSVKAHIPTLFDVGHLTLGSSQQQFWLRTPTSESNMVCRVEYETKSVVVEAKNNCNDNSFWVDALPVCNLNMGKIAFASTALPAAADGKVSEDDAFTVRYNSNTDESVDIFSTWKKVLISGATDSMYLVVQNSKGTYAKALTSETRYVDASEIDGIDNFENCKVWLESTEGRITTAKMASDDLIEFGPMISIDYENKKLTGFDKLEKYSINDGEAFTPEALELAIAQEYFGSTITIKLCANDFHGETEIQSLTIPIIAQTPEGLNSTDETVDGKNDGSITGVSEDMEYSSDKQTWTACTGSEISNLAPGTYYVRKKEVEGVNFASDLSEVTIAKGVEQKRLLTVEVPSLDSAREGYTPEATNITIANDEEKGANFDADISDVSLSGTDAEAFVIKGSGYDWQIQPKEGLTANTDGTARTYEATLTVSYNSTEKEGSPITVDVSFKVFPSDKTWVINDGKISILPGANENENKVVQGDDTVIIPKDEEIVIKGKMLDDGSGNAEAEATSNNITIGSVTAKVTFDNVNVLISEYVNSLRIEDGANVTITAKGTNTFNQPWDGINFTNIVIGKNATVVMKGDDNSLIYAGETFGSSKMIIGEGSTVTVTSGMLNLRTSTQYPPVIGNGTFIVDGGYVKLRCDSFQGQVVKQPIFGPELKVELKNGTIEAYANGNCVNAASFDMSGGLFTTTLPEFSFDPAEFTFTGGMIVNENGYGIADNYGEHDPWTGIVVSSDKTEIYGNAVLDRDFTVTAERPLTVEENETLTIGEDVTLSIGKNANLTINENGSIVNNGTLDVLTDGTLTIKGSISGNKVNLFAHATVVKKEKEAPSGLTAKNPSDDKNVDGAINGTTKEMEYKKDGDSGWTKVSGSKIENLTDGTYYVRYQENENYYASEATTVVVLRTVRYLDENGRQKYVGASPVVNTLSGNVDNQYAVYGESGKTTWCYVEGDITSILRMQMKGDVRLILMDGATLNARLGISVEKDDAGTNALTIYAQSTDDNMGKLIATGFTKKSKYYTYYHSGIGPMGNPCAPGRITIHGGNITAVGGGSAAGIGGGSFDNRIFCAGGTITITGGIVNATSESGEVGIGQAYTYTGKDYIVGNEGTSFSTGAKGKALIYTTSIKVDERDTSDWSGIILEGRNNKTGAVYGIQTISKDFTVKASETLNIAEDSSLVIAKNVTLTNEGTINVLANSYLNVKSGAVIDNKGTINVKADGAVINSGTISGNLLKEEENSQINKKSQDAPQGVEGVSPTTLDNNDGKITGVTADMEMKKGEDGTWTPISGEEVTDLSYGTYYVRYAETNQKYASKAVTITLTKFVIEKTVSYIDENKSSQTIKANTVYSKETTWGSKDETTWLYVEDDVTFDSTITVEGDVRIILMDGATLKADNGILVTEGNAITVYAQSTGDNMGKLIATGKTTPIAEREDLFCCDWIRSQYRCRKHHD